MTYTIQDFGPSDLLTSPVEGARRVKTETGSTSFDLGKSFRLPYEYSVGATPVVLRFTSPVTFRLTEQLLTCDIANARLDAYRDGTESGVWTDVPAFSRNFASTFQDGYTRQVTIETGGAFVPDGPPVDILRVRTSGATAQRGTASFPLGSPRQLPAGTYYLVLSRIDGNETAAGVYLIEWDEL